MQDPTSSWLEAYDLTGGKPLWRYDPASRIVSVRADDRFVFLYDIAYLHLLDHQGKVLWKLPNPAHTSDRFGRNMDYNWIDEQVKLTNDLLLVIDKNMTLTAYDSQTLEQRWKTDLNLGPDQLPKIILTKDCILVADKTMNTCYSSESGAERWHRSFTIERYGAQTGHILYGQIFDSTAGEGKPVAVDDLTGAILGTGTFPADFHSIFTTPASDDGTVIPVNDDGTVLLSLYNSKTGKYLLQKQNLISNQTGWSLPIKPNRNYYSIFENAIVLDNGRGLIEAYRLDSGTKAWDYQATGRFTHVRPLIGDNSFVYAFLSDSHNHTVIRAINVQTGRAFWDFRPPNLSLGLFWEQTKIEDCCLVSGSIVFRKLTPALAIVLKIRNGIVVFCFFATIAALLYYGVQSFSNGCSQLASDKSRKRLVAVCWIVGSPLLNLYLITLISPVALFLMAWLFPLAFPTAIAGIANLWIFSRFKKLFHGHSGFAVLATVVVQSLTWFPLQIFLLSLIQMH